MTDPSATLSEDLTALILRLIDSVPHLEALVLLWENPAQGWTEAAIARRLYQPADVVRSILRDLQRRGLVTGEDGDGGYTIAPAPEIQDTVTRIATAYRHQVSQVATLIHSRAPQPVREFARAFEIRGKDRNK